MRKRKLEREKVRRWKERKKEWASGREKDKMRKEFKKKEKREDEKGRKIMREK